MKSPYWFKPKMYGYGFVPYSVQGWVATGIFIIMLLLSAYASGLLTNDILSLEQLARFVLDTSIITTLFTLLCKDRVEGGLAWRWFKN